MNFLSVMKSKTNPDSNPNPKPNPKPDPNIVGTVHIIEFIIVSKNEFRPWKVECCVEKRFSILPS